MYIFSISCILDSDVFLDRLTMFIVDRKMALHVVQLRGLRFECLVPGA